MADDEGAMSVADSSVADSSAASRLRVLFRRGALAAATLTFVVIVASAFMRHTQAGLACDDWPACYGRVTTAAAGARDASSASAETAAAVAPSGGVRAARLAHRLAATGVLALILGLLLVAWTQKPAWKRDGFLAAVALVLAGGLAVLGIATPGTMLPAVTLGNLLGGYLMLALLAATYAHANARVPVMDGGPSAGIGAASGPATPPLNAPERVTAPVPADRLRWIAVAALALAFAQAWLGGTIGAQYVLTACPTLGPCPGISFDAAGATTAFDPFRTLSVAGGRVVPPTDAAGIHVGHRLLGIAMTVVTLVVALAFRRTHRSAARLLAACAIAAPLLGAAAILALPSLPLTVLHNATAALAIATLAAIVTSR